MKVMRNGRWTGVRCDWCGALDGEIITGPARGLWYESMLSNDRHLCPDCFSTADAAGRAGYRRMTSAPGERRFQRSAGRERACVLVDRRGGWRVEVPGSLPRRFSTLRDAEVFAQAWLDSRAAGGEVVVQDAYHRVMRHLQPH